MSTNKLYPPPSLFETVDTQVDKDVVLPVASTSVLGVTNLYSDPTPSRNPIVPIVIDPFEDSAFGGVIKARGIKNIDSGVNSALYLIGDDAHLIGPNGVLITTDPGSSQKSGVIIVENSTGPILSLSSGASFLSVGTEGSIFAWAGQDPAKEAPILITNVPDPDIGVKYAIDGASEPDSYYNKHISNPEYGDSSIVIRSHGPLILKTRGVNSTDQILLESEAADGPIRLKLGNTDNFLHLLGGDVSLSSSGSLALNANTSPTSQITLNSSDAIKVLQPGDRSDPVFIDEGGSRKIFWPAFSQLNMKTPFGGSIILPQYAILDLKRTIEQPNGTAIVGSPFLTQKFVSSPSLLPISPVKTGTVTHASNVGIFSKLTSNLTYSKWVSGTSYKFGDYVTYRDTSFIPITYYVYRCLASPSLASSTVNPKSDTANWVPIYELPVNPQSGSEEWGDTIYNNSGQFGVTGKSTDQIRIKYPPTTQQIPLGSTPPIPVITEPAYSSAVIVPDPGIYTISVNAKMKIGGVQYVRDYPSYYNSSQSKYFYISPSLEAKLEDYTGDINLDSFSVYLSCIPLSIASTDLYLNYVQFQTGFFDDISLKMRALLSDNAYMPSGNDIMYNNLQYYRETIVSDPVNSSAPSILKPDSLPAVTGISEVYGSRFDFGPTTNGVIEFNISATQYVSERSIFFFPFLANKTQWGALTNVFLASLKLSTQPVVSVSINRVG